MRLFLSNKIKKIEFIENEQVYYYKHCDQLYDFLYLKLSSHSSVTSGRLHLVNLISELIQASSYNFLHAENKLHLANRVSKQLDFTTVLLRLLLWLILEQYVKV